jgi:hypothetical protein
MGSGSSSGFEFGMVASSWIGWNSFAEMELIVR